MFSQISWITLICVPSIVFSISSSLSIILTVCTTLNADEISNPITEPQVNLVLVNGIWIVLYQDDNDRGDDENDIIL